MCYSSVVLGVAILVLFVSTSATGSTSKYYVVDSPLALWSGEKFLKGKNLGIEYTINSGDVESLLSCLILDNNNKASSDDASSASSICSKYVSENIPEVIVLFLEPKISSDMLSTYGSSFENLKHLLQNEKSSLFAPFFDIVGSFVDSLARLGTTVTAEEGKVIYVGKDSSILNGLKEKFSVFQVNLGNFEKEIMRQDIFSNGVTDLIIIPLESKLTSVAEILKGSDILIGKVNDFIDAQTTSYVGIYTAIESSAPQLPIKASNAKRFVTSSLSINQQAAPQRQYEKSVPIFRQFFGGWFWEMFIVWMFLIPLFLIGIAAIDTVQTPIFESKKHKKT